MRNIKFRVFHNPTGRMYGPEAIRKLDLLDHRVEVFESTGLTRDLKMDDCELMQYTGLKDKGGREVFEGDIMDTFRGHMLVMYGQWSQDSGDGDETDYYGWFLRFPQGRGENIMKLAYHPSTDEIVGNCWEHPERVE